MARFVNIFFFSLLAALTGMTVLGGQIFDGDGSDEAGFVPPPPRKEAPPPPANISGGETYIPYPPPPAMPASRSEKKNPPKPPWTSLNPLASMCMIGMKTAV